MNGDVKIFYGNKDVFSGICPTPFLYFDKEYIQYGSNWGSRYIFSIDGQITGRLDSTSLYDLENKKNLLIDNFKKDNLSISIFESGSGIFSSDICSIDSIRFEESSYYAILPFTISASCYDSGSFGLNYGVIDPQDTWDYSEDGEGVVTLRHSVSANGFNSSGNIAISNAKKWVNSRTGISKKINSLKIKNINVYDFLLESFSESIDRFNGKYSIEELYKGDLMQTNFSGNGLLRYSVDSSKSFEDGITKVTIDGSIVGKNNIGLPDMSLLRSKFFSEDFFTIAADYAEKSTGTNKLNKSPYSKNVTENENTSTLSFSLSYDDDPIPPGVAKCIYKVDISENLIKNIIDVKIDAEIICDRGDAVIRWNAVRDYYNNNFNAYNLVLNEYYRIGYSKGFVNVPKSENLTFDEFNKKISYSASWSDRYMPCPDIISSIKEQVNINASLDIHVAQPSYEYDGEHNIQRFGCSNRTTVSISITANAKPDKTIDELKTCVYNEITRLRRIYTKNDDLIVDQRSEMIDEKNRKISLEYSYSFNGNIIK